MPSDALGHVEPTLPRPAPSRPAWWGPIAGGGPLLTGAEPGDDAPSARNQGSPESSRPASPPARAREVLVLTEDDHIANLLPAALELVPHVRTVLVRTVDAAARQLGENLPDLMILDLDRRHMFDPDTIMAVARDTLAALPACSAGRRVPILGLSAELRRSDMVALGLADGLRKPFDLDEFVSHVERLLAS